MIFPIISRIANADNAPFEPASDLPVLNLAAILRRIGQPHQLRNGFIMKGDRLVAAVGLILRDDGPRALWVSWKSDGPGTIDGWRRQRLRIVRGRSRNDRPALRLVCPVSRDPVSRLKFLPKWGYCWPRPRGIQRART